MRWIAYPLEMAIVMKYTVEVASCHLYDIEWELCLWLQQVGDQETPRLNHLKSACFN